MRSFWTFLISRKRQSKINCKEKKLTDDKKDDNCRFHVSRFLCAEDIYPEGPAGDFTNDAFLSCRWFFSCRKTTIPNPPTYCFRYLINPNLYHAKGLFETSHGIIVSQFLSSKVYLARYRTHKVSHRGSITNKQRIDESVEFYFYFLDSL